MRRVLTYALTAAASLACASAAVGGTISGQVFRDYNSNGAKNAGGFVSGSSVTATDVGMGGITVRAFDSAGNQVGEATTAGDGTYSLPVSATGTVRVEFATPAGFQPSFRGSQAATSVQFVDGAGATNVNYAVTVPGEYCQDNPRMVSCVMTSLDLATAQPARATAVSFPAAFTGEQRFDRRGVVEGTSSETARLSGGVETEAGAAALGCTYGIGVDRSGFAYFGTYVKRHCPYGPAGAVNAIYRVNLATGETSTFAVLGSETLPAHNPNVPGGSGLRPYEVDGIRSAAPGSTYYSNVYPNVGRAGLGDVDVTPDGATLLAIEMTQAAPKLWMVDTADPTSRTALAIPNPVVAPATSFNGVSCVGTFHPMGIGVRGDRIAIGGVCGGDETRAVDPATSRTESAAFVMELNAARTGFTTIAATALDFNKGGAFLGQRLLAWNHGEWNNDFVTGMWRNWSDARPAWAPDNPPYYYAWPTPMLSDISFMDDGDLVLAFRDRWGDQNAKRNVGVSYEWSGSGSLLFNMEIVNAGHLLRMCSGPGGYTRESAATCNGTTGAGLVVGEGSALKTATTTERNNSPSYYALGWWRADADGLGSGSVRDCTTNTNSPYDYCARHPYTSHGSIASLPGSTTMWANTWDVNQYFQMGVRALGQCDARSADVGSCGPTAVEDGAMIGGLVLQDDSDETDPYDFRKGGGLGDLELICDAAPLQIGNRIWIDTNKNGIQDPDEPVGKGVTVRLYNSAGALVGTALTDSDGAYYYASNVTKPVAGERSNVGGGLEPGKAFTIKLDNAADFATGGPLAGMSLTSADATATANVMSTSVNSKATLVGAVPTIAVAPRRSGFNDHTFDAGFVPSTQSATESDVPVAMGDYTWLDTNRDGTQGRAEAPLKGVKVTLLNAAGTKRAKNRAGKLAPVATTNAKGKYLISNLRPGTYRARFEIPRKYCFTKPGARGAAINSNPVPVSRRIGVTPKFVIYGEAKGSTTRFSRKGVNADFANLTIDAGVAACSARRVTVTG